MESIRSRVADIKGNATLAARVPVPSGNDEITDLARTMNDMLQRLQSAGDAQRRFVADASHELRSPLATIRAVHEVAGLHPGRTSWQTATSDVLAELDRIDALVSDLLLLARADERGLELRSVDVDLDDLVRAEAGRLTRQGQHLVNVKAPPVRIQGDPDKLARVLRNLMDNAARHASSTVTLTLSASDTSARIDVQDDGPGIPATDSERVFERFVRLDNSRARTSGGTGLGLAIARQIAHAHDGSLTADNPGLPGARFVLTLPLRRMEVR